MSKRLTKAELSVCRKLVWQKWSSNPANLEKRLKQLHTVCLQYWSQPGAREHHSITLKQSWQDPQIRQKRVDGIYEATKRPGVSERKSQASKREWATRCRPIGSEHIGMDGGGNLRVHIKTEDGWMPRARYVMEQKIGRKLEPGEVVHHINGNTLNDHPDNLQLFPSQSEHSRLPHHKQD